MKHLSTQEFIEGGFLQEANRLFFHPLGLALAAEVDLENMDGPVVLGVQDARDDAEGFVFGWRDLQHKMDSWRKADVVMAERLRHLKARFALPDVDGEGVQELPLY